MLRDWRDALYQWSEAGEAHALVTVIEALGSTPREAGAKMAVNADGVVDSIGGGTLELEAIATARRLITEGASTPSLEKIMLGADRDQCCGGACTILFEPFPATGPELVVFGAGHVAHALVKTLDGTTFRLTCIDERPEFLSVPFAGRVKTKLRPNPVAEVALLTPGSIVLVMTHSHDRDFEIVSALLARSDLGRIGLIGSKTKAARFRHRLAAAGIAEAAIAALTCPIGLSGIGGKRPAEIAISTAAWLLRTPDFLEATGP